MRGQTRRLAFRGCTCCVAPALAPPRRNLAQRRVHATGAGSSPAGIFAAAGGPSAPAAAAQTREPTATAAKPHRIDVHHHIAPPKFVEEMTALLQPPTRGWSLERDDGGHGQGRRRHRDHLDHHAGRVDRRQCAGPPRRARVQRLRGEAGRRPSGTLRHVHGAAAARHRGQPARDRARARRAQGRRHLPVHQLPRQVARRSGLRCR